MTRSQLWKLPIIVVATAILATSCSGKGLDATGGSTAAPATTTVWQQVTAQVGPNGEVSKNTALQAFSLAFGPLPGVSVPPGEVGPIPSGTGALRWLVAHWSEISPAQRDAAAKLVPGLAAAAHDPEIAGGGPIGVVQPASVGAAPHKPGPKRAALTKLAKEAAAEISARVGVRLTMTVNADVRPTESSTSYAETFPLNAKGGWPGKPALCQISVNPQHSLEGPMLEMVITHEVWHCFQGQIVGLEGFWSGSIPSWLMEGQAEWVGFALRDLQLDDEYWPDYIEHPEWRLFRRSYSAIGFYAQLTHTGHDTWHVLVPMLRAGGSVAAFQASGAAGDGFLNSWASSFFREATLGDAWQMSGPGLAEGPGAKAGALAVSNGVGTPYAAAAYTNAIFKLSSAADVIVFAVSGHARIGDPTGDHALTNGMAFCAKEGGCTCPAGNKYEGPPLINVATTSFFAVTGGPGGTKGSATGKSLEEFCSKPPVKVRTLQVKGCPPTGWMSQLMRMPYQFDGNGVSPGFKVPAGQIWCVYVPVAEVPGSVRLYFWNLPKGKDMDSRPQAKPTVVPGLDKAVFDVNPNSGFGAAAIHGQVGRVALGVEVMVKGKPRPDLTRQLLDRILTTYLK